MIQASHSQARTRAGASVLDDFEIATTIQRSWWGILSTSAGDEPYAVPVAYGWNGEHVYIASLDGRKIRNLMMNPHACLSIAEVESGAAWRSVVIEGSVEWLTRPKDLARAFTALAMQCGRPVVPPSAARLLEAKVFRIIPRSIHGRARGALP
jgi:nitroimidazol reductase NimA-like FMN-containing flavoprotein (pyridoxamine 5'-phosphate oxidase superfamily)